MDIDELPKLARKRQIRDTIEGEPARIIEESPAKRVPSACASASSSDTAIGTIRNTQTQVSGVTNTGGSARQHNLTIGQRISPRYSVRDPGPFVVYVYPINRDNAIHPTLISRLIVKSGIPDILEIKKIGRGKVLIEVKSASAANRLVENQAFPQNDLKAFIPAYKVLRTGIIQDVPQQIDIDNIKEDIESSRARIIDIQRLNRRVVRDNKVEYLPSRTLRVKFAGQLLPQEIFIFKVRHAVRPYIPLPRMCHSCYRIGHVSKTCKSSPRCLFCGEGKHNTTGNTDSGYTCHMKDESPKCINCQGSHWTESILVIHIKHMQGYWDLVRIPTLINNSSNISRDHVLPHFSKQRPARSTVSAGPGYDAGAHQQVLHEINGKIPYSSGNGVAFQKDSLPQRPRLGADYDIMALLENLGNLFRSGKAEKDKPRSLYDEAFECAYDSDCTSSTSVLDLALASPQLALSCDTFIESDSLGSDHLPVVTTVGAGLALQRKFYYKLPLKDEELKKAIFDKLFSSVCDSSSLTEGNVLGCYEDFTKNLIECVREFFPENKRLPRSSVGVEKLKPPPWWNNLCTEAVGLRREAIGRLIRTPSEESLQGFRRARRECLKILSQQRRKGWQTFVGGFNSKTPTSQIWALIKSFKRKASSTKSPSAQCELIKASSDAISKLCPPFAYFDRSTTLSDMKADDSRNPEVCKWLDDPITFDELSSAILTVRKKSAPGLDQISYELLDLLPAQHLDYLLSLFNEIFSQGVFPDSWTSSLVVLIPKADGKSVRPISLMSCVCKLMERVLYRRLVWFVESRPILPQSQAGFRPFRSCDDNLAVLTTAIRSGFLEKSVTIAVFLDVAGAFDSVDPFLLLGDLADVGVPALFRKFIENLISCRDLSFVVDGEIQGPFRAFKGTPQGSTLSPLLFDIYLKDINQHLHPGSHLLQYADDVVLYSSHRDPAVAMESIQNSLNNIYNYLKFRNLEVSPHKSKWIAFSRKRDLKISLDISMDGKVIPRVPSHRFLGVILDQNLKGKEHLEYLIEKGRKISNIISTLSGIVWGSHPGLLLTIYRSTFRSAVEYGCQFFVWKSSSAEFVKLQRLQYKIIRKAMGYRISTPINVMLAEAKEHSFSIRLNLTASKFIYKAMASKCSPVYRSLEEMEIIATRRKCKIEAIKNSRLFKYFVTTRGEKRTVYRTTFPPAFWYSYEVFSLKLGYVDVMQGSDKNDKLLTKADFYHKSFQLRQNATSFYTDGSKSDEGYTGAAVVSPSMNGDIRHKLPASTSIFSAELWAIYQAVLAILDLDISKCVIFSDSKSTLEALCNTRKIHRNYIIYYIKQALFEATKQGKVVTFFWIPAHVGIPGNEAADSAAKDAAVKGFKPPFRVPYEDMRESLEALDAEAIREITSKESKSLEASDTKHFRKEKKESLEALDAKQFGK
ncbi:PREDICTED: uncharacterized protein LOC108775675 [Cyphomyrmex costatus]|uniref:uncharacterized protein LOC108775675 n=1 Tax=Cyphomyrmex costatus TaxID=456900 RepID=UPI0008522A8A|nr:PREDICTED: uncharacterized protein LOC108775675 [Cyphomyrmex costatus]